MLHKFILIVSLIGLVVGASFVPAGASPHHQATAYPVITSENVANLTQVDLWGQGRYGAVTWSPDNKSIYLSKSTGMYRVPADNINTEPELVLTEDVAQWSFGYDGHEIVLSRSRHGFTVWNINDQSVLFTIEGADVTAQLSADGSFIVILDSSTDIFQTLDSHTGEVLNEYELPSEFNYSSFIISQALGKLYLYNDSTLHMVDMFSGEIINSYTTSNRTMSMLESPDASLIALYDGSTEDNVLFLDTETLTEVANWEAEIVNATFTPDGKYLVGNNGIWDIETQSEIYPLPLQFRNLWFSPDGTKLFTQEALYNFGDFTSGDTMPTPIAEFDATLSDLAFNEDGSQVAVIQSLSISFTQSIDLLTIIDTATGAVLQEHDVRTFAYDAVAFSPDSTQLVISSEAMQTVWVVDILTHEIIHEIPNFKVTNIIARGNNEFVLAGSEEVYLLDATSGEITATLSGHGDDVRSVAFSADDSLLATGDTDGKIIIWDMTTLEIQQELDLGDWVSQLTFTPDNALLIAKYYNALPMVFDLATGEAIEWGDFSQAERANDFALNAAGTELVFAGQNVYAWDITDIEADARLYETSSSVSPMNFILYSHDESLLIGSRHNELLIWEIASGELIYEQEFHIFSAGDLTISPDGTLLASTSDDGTVRLYAVVE